MNAKGNIFAEDGLLELTDTELETICAGSSSFTIRNNFNPAGFTQTAGLANSSFTSASFPELTTTGNNFTIGGSAFDGGNSYINGINGNTFP